MLRRLVFIAAIVPAIFATQTASSQAPTPPLNGGQDGRGARGTGATQNPNSVSPLEFLIDPPTLINLNGSFKATRIETQR
jgi:hypothetical protein